jgi:hypothetical protein
MRDGLYNSLYNTPLPSPTDLEAAVADPSNAEYLLMTQKHGWDLLSALVDQDLIVCLGYAGRAHQVADPGGG